MQSHPKLALLVAALAVISCGDPVSTSNDNTVNVTVGGPPPEPCNGDPDGFCNLDGGDPEKCDCFDCVEHPVCVNLCTDDDNCSQMELEVGGCACADCQVECMMGNGAGPGSGASGPGPGGGGNGGMPVGGGGNGGMPMGGGGVGGMPMGGGGVGGMPMGGGGAGGAAGGAGGAPVTTTM